MIEGREWKFSRHMNKVFEYRPEIRVKWILETINNSDFKQEVSKVEVRYWKEIEEFGGRYLRVVVNPINRVIITAFFDRSFKPWKLDMTKK